MLQRPGDSYAVWLFWHGPEREFHGWYLNLQEPFRRTAEGYDTQDLELDIWVPREGGWVLKDDELLDVRVARGPFHARSGPCDSTRGPTHHRRARRRPPLVGRRLGRLATGWFNRSSPGFATFTVTPHTGLSEGGIQSASGIVPTPRGDIHVSWSQDGRGRLDLKVSAPPGTTWTNAPSKLRKPPTTKKPVKPRR